MLQHFWNKKNITFITDRDDEIKSLSQQINYTNLTYHYNIRGASTKKLSGFKFPLGFLRNISDGDTKLEEVKKQKYFKLNLNETKRGKQ